MTDIITTADKLACTRRDAAAQAAGYRKKQTPLQQIQKLWAKLDRAGRDDHWVWLISQCQTCGRAAESPGAMGGICNACMDEWTKKKEAEGVL